MGNTVIDSETRNFLMHSEITKGYYWLMQLLVQHTEVTIELIETMPPEKQRFFDSMLAEFVKTAVTEWEKDKSNPVEDMGPDAVPECRKTWIMCSLCNVPVRFIYHIVNKINGNKMIICAECVQRFGFLHEEEMKKLEKDASRNLYYHALNRKCPGISRLVTNEWNHYLDRYYYVIPLMLNEDCHYVKQI